MIRLDASDYTVRTDAPEGDGTFAWTSTTLVLVRAWTGTDATAAGLGWTYGPAATVSIVDDVLVPVLAPMLAPVLAPTGRLRRRGGVWPGGRRRCSSG